jgi:hypothetical protein
MCLQLRSPTAHQIWVHLGSLLMGNKPSQAVHLECELHNLAQGEMSSHDYCHRLQQLAFSLVHLQSVLHREGKDGIRKKR